MLFIRLFSETEYSNKFGNLLSKKQKEKEKLCGVLTNGCILNTCISCLYLNNYKPLNPTSNKHNHKLLITSLLQCTMSVRIYSVTQRGIDDGF